MDGEQARIEQDLDRVDAALDALDAGELDEAEALTVELADRGSFRPDADVRQAAAEAVAAEPADRAVGGDDSPQLA